MKAYYSVALLCLSCVGARADFNLQIGVGNLLDAGGSTMPASSLFILVADVNGNGFGGPGPGSFVSGDDLVLIHAALDGPGQINRQYNVSVNVASGVPVGLFWFPTIAATDYGNAGLPLYGTQYGFYRDPVANGGSGTGTDGSDPWFTLGTGGQSTLLFFTASVGGSNPNSAGQALSLVPEASNLITAGLALGVCALGLARGVRQGLVKQS